MRKDKTAGRDRKRIVTFVMLAYGITWLIWMPRALSHFLGREGGVSKWYHLLGGLGPFLAAILTTLLFDGGSGVRHYFKTRLLGRPKLKWLGVGLGMPAGFFLIAVVGSRLIQGHWIRLADIGLNSKAPVSNPWLIWLVWCFFYGLGEEGGWRGFLMPELTKHNEARISTLYVALIWAPWHLPLFFYDPDFMTMGPFGAAGWFVGLVFGSLLLGWLAKQSRWNLWPVILWHGTFDFFTTSNKLGPFVPAAMSMMVIAVAFWIARRYGKSLDLAPEARPSPAA